MSDVLYKLSCAIYGHKGDVRSVAVTSDGKIVSGSRDMTAKLWATDETGYRYREYLTLLSHGHFVSSVCTLPPNNKFPHGLIITGSNDKTLRLFDGVQSDPVAVLSGHTDTVCKISVGVDQNTILSSSWDQTAKLWDLVACQPLVQFSGHEAAVWSVIQLSSGKIATGSADKTIKIWIKNGTCLGTLYGHKDCIRDLAMAAPNEILSCSNDATIKYWNIDTGECLSTFYGHNHFIYSITCLGVMNFVTSSEDGSVKLWNNGEVIETIFIPASSIWSVAVLHNGDIVTGSSDGIIRVFSKDPLRHATLEELKIYEDHISNLKNPSNSEIGSIKVSELPGEEALRERGKKDGQTLLIQVKGSAVAYSWSEKEEKWNLIGNVIGSSENNEVSETEKPKYNGKAYDYVFSVDIEPGKPLLKLPYNKTDDPWVAAQKFIHDNNLSQHFLEEVANFIIRNSSVAESQTNNLSEFFDPFTGETRYIPGSNSPNSGAKNQSSKDIVLSTNSYFPQKDFLRFDQANVKQILGKLLEFNKKSGNGSPFISDKQIENLVKICDCEHSCQTEDIETLNYLLEWPEEIVFPVLDVMRLAIRNKEANKILCNDSLIPKLMKYLSSNSKISSNTMLALRVLSNMLAGEAGLSLADRHKLKLLSVIDNISPPYNKPLQVAMSTLLLNLSVMLKRSSTSCGQKEALVVSQHILSKLSDQEALFRAFVALGTLLHDVSDKENYSSDFKSILLKHRNDSSLEPKIQQCCHHILQMLQ